MADLYSHQAAAAPGVRPLRIFLWLAASAALPVVLLFAFNYATDRYSVFHADRSFSPRSNMNFVRMEYLLREGDTHRVLMLGSSRAQALLAHERIDESAYTYPSPGGRIHHHYENLRVLLETGVRPELVLLGIGEAVIKIPPLTWQDLSPNGRLHPRVSGMHPARFYWEYLALLPEWSHVEHLLTVIESKLEGEGLTGSAWEARTGRYYCFRCQEDIFSRPPEQHVVRLREAMNIQKTRNTAESAVETVQKMKSLAETYGFRLFVFVDPIYQEKYLLDDFSTYTDFKRLLAGITPFLDFNNLHPEFANPRNFTDVIHYGTQTGEKLTDDIRSALRGDIDDLQLGVWVTPDNVDAYLDAETARYAELQAAPP